jgi:hypothetical protein
MLSIVSLLPMVLMETRALGLWRQQETLRVDDR